MTRLCIFIGIIFTVVRLLYHMPVKALLNTLLNNLSIIVNPLNSYYTTFRLYRSHLSSLCATWAGHSILSGLKSVNIKKINASGFTAHMSPISVGSLMSCPACPTTSKRENLYNAKATDNTLWLSTGKKNMSLIDTLRKTFF